jgi:hypothetical protein
MWNIYGKCFITFLEDSLDDNKPTNSEDTFVANTFGKLLGPFNTYAKTIMSIITLFNTLVCLYKINRIHST